ncbi:MAG: hypothetical protein ACOYH4_04080 [Saccharofermentanales bacterium]|jgi:hypothetical protein
MDHLEGKKLLLLGGSRNMKEIFDEAHRMGIRVGVTDWYDVDRSPVKRMADWAHDVSIADDRALAALIRREGYDGVLTGYTDSYLPFYAKLCDRVGLPCYGTEHQFEILTHKSLYKPVLERYGVPTLTSLDADEITKGFDGFPIILKPTAGSGGKGLVIVEDVASFHKVMAGAGDTQYIIEPFLAADRQEMTAFFLFVDGDIYLTGTANRFLSKPQGDKIGLPILYSLPSSFDATFRAQTAPPLMRMFRDLRLRDGMLFAQCFIHEGQAKVYDLGYRLTGSLEYKLLDRMYGVNPLRMMIRHSLTGKMTDDAQELVDAFSPEGHGYGFNVTVLGKEGTIAHVEGVESMLAMPQVMDCVFKMVPGESITPAMIGTLGQIVARIFFVADTLEEAEDTLRNIYRVLRMYDTAGENMILDTFKPERLRATYRKIGS